MQKLIFLFVSLICLMASCSADDIIGRTDTVDTLRADGYLRMCITMPSARDSRVANDDFENGLPAEYAIHSAYLFLFEGDNDDELKAKFHSAYNISAVSTEVNPDGSQITTTTTRVVRRLDNGKDDFRKKKHFALIFFNAEDFVKISRDELTVSVDGLEIKSVQEPSAFKQHMTLEQFLQLEKKMTNPDALNPFISRTKGFFMCSAPLLDKPGGSNSNKDGLTGGHVHYTCPVSDKIYDTESEAQANPAAACYVERAVAKVTMQEKLTNDQLEIPNLDIVTVDAKGHLQSTTTKPKCKLVGWMLDNTNMRSYLVRNYDTQWNTIQTNSPTPANGLRFVCEKPAASQSGRFRTYWAKDPNYSTDGATHADDLNQIYTDLNIPSALDNPVPSASDPFPMGFGDNFPQYCFENTFDVANQTQDQTTRIIAKIQIDNEQTDKDFYVVNNDFYQLYTEKALETKFHVDSLIKAAIANNPNIKKAYETKIKNMYPGDPLSAHPLVAGNCYYKQEVAADGLYRITSVWVNLAEGVNIEGNIDELSSTTWEQELGFNLNIKKFTDGIAYYPIRIKHFGDDLTPWDEDEYGSVRPTPSTIYPGDEATRANNYLGRYGVVRNNWYDVSIQSISSLGDPIIPKPTTKADDELDNFIQVNINILSWTLRPQGADL
mgnify:FL=1